MTIDIDKYISLGEIIKSVFPSEIKRFLLNYMDNDHTYITTKNLAWDYLSLYYTVSYLHLDEREQLLRILSRKFSREIHKLIREGILEKFNNKTYKKREKRSKGIRLTSYDIP